MCASGTALTISNEVGILLICHLLCCTILNVVLNLDQASSGTAFQHIHSMNDFTGSESNHCDHFFNIVGGTVPSRTPTLITSITAAFSGFSCSLLFLSHLTVASRHCPNTQCPVSGGLSKQTELVVISKLMAPCLKAQTSGINIKIKQHW